MLVDLRAGAASLSDLAELRGAHPDAALLAVVDPTMPLSDVYGAGAIAALPGDPEVVAAYVAICGGPDAVWPLKARGSSRTRTPVSRGCAAYSASSARG